MQRDLSRRKKKRLPVWTHPGLYALARAGSSLLNIAGDAQSMRLASALAGRYARLDHNKARLERAQRNIAWCFPHWRSEHVQSCAIAAYKHLFTLAVEFAIAPRVMSVDAWPDRVRLGDVGETLEILVQERPCILVTGHCGNWELLGSAIGGLGFPIHALYRPLDVKPLDRWVRATRARQGVDLLDKFQAAGQLPGIANRNEPIAFIADQNAGERGLFVPFFDRLASAYKSIGLLAIRSGAPIICGHTRRLATADSPRLRHQLDIVDIIRPADWSDQPDPLYYITARYRRAIETMVRRAPEQYLWMHRYWKSRPRHERLDRPFPAALANKIQALPWMTPERLAKIKDRSARDAAELNRSAA